MRWMWNRLRERRGREPEQSIPPPRTGSPRRTASPRSNSLCAVTVISRRQRAWLVLEEPAREHQEDARRGLDDVYKALEALERVVERDEGK